MVAAAWSDSILWHSVGAVLLVTFTAWVAAVSAGASATLSGMDTTTAHGYMVEAEWDGRQLRARGTNKASQVALAGQDHAAGDVVIPAGEIASARLKPASMMTNGNLIVRTVDGRKVQLHFRRKQADDFQALYEAMLPFLPVDEPAVKVTHLSRWWAYCPCGWARPGDDWHAAYTFARDHAESSLT